MLIESREILPVEELSENLLNNQSKDPALDNSQPTSSQILHTLQEVEALVENLAASWHSSPQILQKRNLHRTAYRRPIEITAFDEKTQQPTGPIKMAEGRDLSEGGISFSHDDHLPFRFVVVTFTQANGDRESVVTKLNWCRFTREGTYQSGGKFLRMIQLSGERSVAPSDSDDS